MATLDLPWGAHGWIKSGEEAGELLSPPQVDRPGLGGDCRGGQDQRPVVDPLRRSWALQLPCLRVIAKFERCAILQPQEVLVPDVTKPQVRTACSR